MGNSLKQWKERRQHKRIAMNLQATFLYGTQKFSSLTENISEGGVLLKEELPKELNDQVLVIHLSSPDKSKTIEFKARVLKDKEEAKHIQFIETHEAGIVQLKSWFEQALFLAKKP